MSLFPLASQPYVLSIDLISSRDGNGRPDGFEEFRLYIQPRSQKRNRSLGVTLCGASPPFRCPAAQQAANLFHAGVVGCFTLKCFRGFNRIFARAEETQKEILRQEV